MALPKILVTFETAAGEELGPVRVLAADKIGTEKTCRTQGWDYSDGPRAHTLMGFYAAKRQGLTAAADYTSFMEDVADYSITNKDAEDSDTPTEAGTGS